MPGNTARQNYCSQTTLTNTYSKDGILYNYHSKEETELPRGRRRGGTTLHPDNFNLIPKLPWEKELGEEHAIKM